MCSSDICYRQAQFVRWPNSIRKEKEVEESVGMINETSWLSVICGACGIILLALYILMSPADSTVESSEQQQKTVKLTIAAP